jgi:uncharacterized membrane protein YtjA (UPF0391 family)
MLDRWLMTHGDGWHRRASLGTAVYINKVGFCRLIVATIVGRLGNGRVVHARLGVGGIFFFPFLFFCFVCLFRGRPSRLFCRHNDGTNDKPYDSQKENNGLVTMSRGKQKF